MAQRIIPLRSTIEPPLLDDWHPVADVGALVTGRDYKTKLFGIPLTIAISDKAATPAIQSGDGGAVDAKVKYGHVWACLGVPARDVVAIPEADEPGRCSVSGGSLGVASSGLRTVENFFDLAHFPFVHTNYLGVEPYTQVMPYEVVVSPDGLRTSICQFYQTFQPAGAPATGEHVSYEYRVFRPYSVGLFKANPHHPERRDCVALFVQPVDEETCIAHSWLAYVPDKIERSQIRWFMQLIMAQDKPILENQLPKRLPLSLRTENSLRCDTLSIAYRRWLRDLKVTYGAIPADG